MSRPLLVTARLVSPLAGDAPQLDALLETMLAAIDAAGRGNLDRSQPAPPQANIPIPIRRERIGPWQVGLCSNPILSVPASESVGYVHKRIAVEHSGMLHPQSRVVVATTNTWAKSYRLPLRERLVEFVKWFTVGDQREVLNVVRRVKFIGKKVSVGYGVVAEWTVDAIENDLSWYAPTEHGPMLMRTLPTGDWLPPSLVGFRKDFGAAVSPYWHPERYTEIVVPC